MSESKHHVTAAFTRAWVVQVGAQTPETAFITVKSAVETYLARPTSSCKQLFDVRIREIPSLRIRRSLFAQASNDTDSNCVIS